MEGREGAPSLKRPSFPAADKLSDRETLLLENLLCRLETKVQAILEEVLGKKVRVGKSSFTLVHPPGETEPEAPEEATFFTEPGCLLPLALSLTPALAVLLLDRLLGGRGQTVEPKPLTELEYELLAPLVASFASLVYREISGEERAPAIAKMGESPPRPNGQVLEWRFPVVFEDRQEVIKVESPVDAVRAAIKLENGALSLPQTRGPNPRIRQQLLDVSLEISCHLGRTRVTVEDFLRIGRGDILRLDEKPGDPISVRIESLPGFTGTAGIFEGQIAVQILAPERSEDGGRGR